MFMRALAPVYEAKEARFWQVFVVFFGYNKSNSVLNDGVSAIRNR